MGMEFNFNNLEAKLDEMAKKVGNEILDAALDAGVQVFEERMEANVPIDTSELKGNLGEIKKTGSGTGRKSILGIKSNDRDIIARGYYQEYGTERMSGKHWMKKSFDEAKTKANEKIIEVLREALK